MLKKRCKTEQRKQKRWFLRHSKKTRERFIEQFGGCLSAAYGREKLIKLRGDRQYKAANK